MNTLQTVLASSGEDWNHGWWPLWWLVWLGVIVAIVWFVTRRRRPTERSGQDRARDILAERFARGELTGEEYRERLAEL
jgi:putative membrane protein